MKQLIIAILMLVIYTSTNAQVPTKNKIPLTKLSEIKAILPEGTELKDSSIVLKKGYYYRYEMKNVLVSAKSNGIITGSFACGGCTMKGGECILKGESGQNFLICTGCSGCMIIVEKGESRYAVTGISLKL